MSTEPTYLRYVSRVSPALLERTLFKNTFCDWGYFDYSFSVDFCLCFTVLSVSIVFSIFELNILCWLMLAGNLIQQLLTEHGEKEASESSQLCSWKHCELHLPT